MNDTHADYDLRGYLNRLEATSPGEILRISEEVDLDYVATAIVFELERLDRSPVLWLERVKGSRFGVIMNLFGARRRFADALGVAQDELSQVWSRADVVPVAPELVEHAPVHDVVYRDDAADLGLLPIMRHFVEDGGSYITNAMVVAQDPETGTHNASFHRMQVNGRSRLGTSLHSRRHLWQYAGKARALGLDRLPVVVVIGCHPLITMGSGLWKGSIDTDEYEVVGGFLQRPLALVPGITVPLSAPAEAEIIVEGQLLLDVEEPEGPFGEFTGYASERSTNHAIEVTAIAHRENALYQSIVPGISDEHTLLLGISQEARTLKLLRVQHANVVDVHYPKSGTCLMHCYVSLRDPARGQARNVAAAALGDNLSLKLVVVVDADVDVFDEQQVLWAVATRFQAGSDLDVLRDAMGAVLDPSNRAGLTDKLVIDATRKAHPYAPRHTLPESAVARARALLGT